MSASTCSIDKLLKNFATVYTKKVQNSVIMAMAKCVWIFLILCATQWLVSKLGAKYILDKTIDGATPLHMAAGEVDCGW